MSVVLDEKVDELSGNTPELYVDGEKTTNLKFQRLSQEQYIDLLTSDSINPNCLYMVSSTVQHTYGERITDVGEGVVSSDALPKWQIERDFVTKERLSSAISALNDSSTIGDMLSALRNLI